MSEIKVQELVSPFGWDHSIVVVSECPMCIRNRCPALAYHTIYDLVTLLQPVLPPSCGADKVNWLVPDKCSFFCFLLSTYKLYWFHQGNKAQMSSHRSKSSLKAGTLGHFSQGVSHLVLLKVSVSSLSSLPCRGVPAVLVRRGREASALRC